jgi:hypothetical protein
LVWEILDDIIIDATGMLANDVDELLATLFKEHQPDGFYRVMLNYPPMYMDTKIRVGRIDKDQIQEFIRERRVTSASTT